MLLTKLKLAAASLIASISGNFVGILPDMPSTSAGKTDAPLRHRPRGGNRHTPRTRNMPNATKIWDGSYVHNDVPGLIPWGISGSKLARKAAEGRIGIRK